MIESLNLKVEGKILLYKTGSQTLCLGAVRPAIVYHGIQKKYFNKIIQNKTFQMINKTRDESGFKKEKKTLAEFGKSKPLTYQHLVNLVT